MTRFQNRLGSAASMIGSTLAHDEVTAHLGSGGMGDVYQATETKLGRPVALKKGREMNLIVSLVIGGIIGWLASMVMKTNAQMGLIANVIVGVVGSMLGYFVAGLLGLGASNAIGGYLIAIAGAALLIAILRAAGVFR